MATFYRSGFKRFKDSKAVPPTYVVREGMDFWVKGTFRDSGRVMVNGPYRMAGANFMANDMKSKYGDLVVVEVIDRQNNVVDSLV